MKPSHIGHRGRAFHHRQVAFVFVSKRRPFRRLFAGLQFRIGPIPIPSAGNPRMVRGAFRGDNRLMSFDENPPSPDRLVNPHKRTTKVNVAVVIGVLAFLLLGVGAVLWFSNTSPR